MTLSLAALGLGKPSANLFEVKLSHGWPLELTDRARRKVFRYRARDGQQYVCRCLKQWSAYLDFTPRSSL